MDQRVKETYADTSSATLREALYDPYVKAIRQASDRILGSDKGGIVAFVTNGGFIDAKSFDGFRKAIAKEFDAIYCYNLRGDQRTAGELSRMEAGKIFGSGSRAGVAILLLVKKPGDSSGATVYYSDIGDYLGREEKLEMLAESSLGTTDWQIITTECTRRLDKPTVRRVSVTAPSGLRGKWHYRYAPNLSVGIGGVGDEAGRLVLWNSSDKRLREHVGRTVEFYERTREAFAKTKSSAKSKRQDSRSQEVRRQHARSNSIGTPKAVVHLANGQGV